MNKKPSSAAIILEETYVYKVELGTIPVMEWLSGEGCLRIQVPYDGTRLPNDIGSQDKYRLGQLKLVQEDRGLESELIPIEIEAGERWPKLLKSGKQVIYEIEYHVERPQKTIVSLSGEINDTLYEDNDQLARKIIGDIDSFNNPLTLRLQLITSDETVASRGEATRELEDLRLQGENEKHTFLPVVKGKISKKELSQTLNALANSGGGVALLGLDKVGNISSLSDTDEKREDATKFILQAALLSQPIIPLVQVRFLAAPPTKLEDPTSADVEDQMVVYIEVGNDEDIEYMMDNTVFILQRKKIVTKRKQKKIEPRQFARTKIRAKVAVWMAKFFYDDSYTYSDNSDTLVLEINSDLEQLELGAYLSGIISAGKEEKVIKIEGLQTLYVNEREKQHKNLQYLMQSYLDQEIEKIIPPLESPKLKIILGKEPYALVFPPECHSPISFYGGQGYIWKNMALEEITPNEMLSKYLLALSQSNHQKVPDEVWLQSGFVRWPICPAPDGSYRNRSYFESHDNNPYPGYEAQFHRQTWKPRKFRSSGIGEGFWLNLNVPLRYLALNLGDDDKIELPEELLAEGKVTCCLEHSLASGIDIKVEEDTDNYLHGLPVFKRTIVELEYKARLAEIFRDREKSIILRFPIKAILLNQKRIADIQQTCTDIGFRMNQIEDWDWEGKNGEIEWVRLSGICRRQYYDISLRMGLICNQNLLDRELQFGDWNDNQLVKSAILDIRILLSGKGDGVVEEMTRLQMLLYHQIDSRLQYLQE